MDNHKLGIIVPYRDRYEQLEIFKKRIVRFLEDKNIDYEVIIVEQDNAKLFNRGMLLNIGFTYAEKLGCDYVVFHDVDTIPYKVDYSYSDIPIHLATNFMKANNMSKIVFDTYFGGVTMFTVKDFKKINGFSNKYWGWGFEDDDLLLRCIKNGLSLKKKKIKNRIISRPSLKFNGVNSYVRGKNVINFKKDFSIFISFCPDKIICNHKKMSDDYTIFSIPGYDMSISYNSYSRYNFCTFDEEKNSLYVNSNITTNYQTTICVTFNRKNKKIHVYQDGKKIGVINHKNPLMDYSNEEYFYIGAGNPLREDNPNYFRGIFDQFIVFEGVLNELDVKHIETEYFLRPVVVSYDGENIQNYKLTDLSGNGNDGEIYNCEIIPPTNNSTKTIDVPHRRKSKFVLLPHEENGFVGNGWKNDLIRWNQLRYYNEVSLNDELLYNDGLSDLVFAEHGVENDNKITKIIVGI